MTGNNGDRPPEPKSVAAAIEGISKPLITLLFRSWAERLERAINDLQIELDTELGIANIDLPRYQEWEYVGNISASTEFEESLEKFNMVMRAAIRPLDAEETENWEKIDADFMILDDLKRLVEELWDAAKMMERYDARQ